MTGRLDDRVHPFRGGPTARPIREPMRGGVRRWTVAAAIVAMSLVPRRSATLESGLPILSIVLISCCQVMDVSAGGGGWALRVTDPVALEPEGRGLLDFLWPPSTWPVEGPSCDTPFRCHVVGMPKSRLLGCVPVSRRTRALCVQRGRRRILSCVGAVARRGEREGGAGEPPAASRASRYGGTHGWPDDEAITGCSSPY